MLIMCEMVSNDGIKFNHDSTNVFVALIVKP